MQQQINPVLEGELEEGESILWMSQPNPKGGGMMMPGRVFAILSIVFGGVVLVAVIVIAILLLSVREDVGVNSAVLSLSIVAAVFLFMVILFAIFAVVFKGSLKRTVYAVTNFRVLIVTSGNALTVNSYRKAGLGSITRIERPDGTGDLIFGASGGAGVYGYGNYGYGNSQYNSGMYNTAAMSAGKFLGIANVRDVERLIQKTFFADSPSF